MSSVSKKRHLACFLSFVFIVAAAFAQNSSTARDGAPAGDGVAAGTGAGSDETAIYLDGTGVGVAQVNASADGKTKAPSSIWILVRIVVVLALVCAGIYGVVYLLKKSSGGNAGNDPYLKNVASLYFSPNKSVQVITLGERAYMVGVTDQAINLLGEVTDRELVDAMNLNTDKKNPIPPGTFQNLMANFFPGAKRSPGAGAGAGTDTNAGTSRNGASFGGADFIRSQRERLKNAGVTGDSGDIANADEGGPGRGEA
jgi:flagellar protein FliO/FliZ